MISIGTVFPSSPPFLLILRRGGIKRGESKLASNQFPMCSPQSGSLRDVHGVTREEKRRGRKETEVTRRIKGEIKRSITVADSF